MKLKTSQLDNSFIILPYRFLAESNVYKNWASTKKTCMKSIYYIYYNKDIYKIKFNRIFSFTDRLLITTNRKNFIQLVSFTEYSARFGFFILVFRHEPFSVRSGNIV